jgi:predicted nucleotidyltransferase
LADALFTDTQQRVLGLVFGQPERSFMLTELIRLARTGTGAVQRELQRLDQAGIVTVESVAGRKYVKANPATPVFEELRGIIDKTTGVTAEVNRALERIRVRLRFAILFGSVAKGTDVSQSDIDVLLVSDDLTQEDAFDALKAAEKRLGRRINPTIYRAEEFRRRRQTKNPFLTKVLAGKYVVLAGSEDAALAP